MSFFIIMIVVAIACSVISIKTLIGYGDLNLWYKITVSLVVLLGWFAPMWTRALRKFHSLDSFDYITYNLGYFLFGFVFILFSFLIIRDIAWYIGYGIGKISSLKIADPKDFEVLFKANITVIALSILTSFYSLYEGTKIPNIKEISISSPKIRKDFNLVTVTDLHINRATKTSKVKAVVEKINALNPDAIALVGDIIDDNPQFMKDQLEALSKLKAKNGVYASLGNHEIHRGYILSSVKIKALGFKLLLNSGESLGGYGVYLAGIPDYGTSQYSKELNIDLEKTVKASAKNEYRILLSHNPKFFDFIAGEIDLQLSGHTHGGQIFPFHIPVKQANNYLAGIYEKDNKKLFVSRGAGTWGPPMRLFAPSDITVIKLHP